MEECVAYILPLLKRYKSFVIHSIVRRERRALNKSLFVQQIAAKMQRFIDEVEQDHYQRELYELLVLHLNQQSTLQEFFSEAEPLRQRWLMEQSREELNQSFIPVNEFVNEKDRPRILKRLTKYMFYKLAVDELLKDADRLRGQAATPHPPHDPQAKTEAPEPFKWCGKHPTEQIKKLFAGLKQAGFMPVETSIRSFKSIFSLSGALDPVRWEDSPQKLIYLFEQLARNGYIEVPPHIDVFIEKEQQERSEKQAFSTWLNEKLILCLIGKKGEPYTNKRLKHAKDEIRRKQAGNKRFDTARIDSLVNSL